MFRFNLVGPNGKVIATSEAYERKQSALHGIESVKQNAPGAEVDDQTGEYWSVSWQPVGKDLAQARKHLLIMLAKPDRYANTILAAGITRAVAHQDAALAESIAHGNAERLFNL